MPAKKYKVTLSKEERELLLDLLSKGKAAAIKLKHAHILLKADQGEAGPAWDDKIIADAFNVHMSTVQRTRQSFVEEGLQAALNRKKRLEPPRCPKFDGEKEAHLIALACSAPPEGRKGWTLRLLADKMVQLEYFESLSHETVRGVLKKRNKALA